MNATHLTAVGRLGADPEMRFTPTGVAVASFSIACNDRVKAPDGSWTDGPTVWLRCTAWRELAQNAADTLHKGDRVVLVGSLKEREFDRADGTKGRVLEVTVEEISPSLRFSAVRATTQTSTDSGWQSDQPPF